jgi:extracellular solute-binding protein
MWGLLESYSALARASPQECCGLALGSILSTTAGSEALVLFGAGSLRGVITQIAADSQARNCGTVRTESGPSGLMRKRIEQGERVDLFASADMSYPLKLRAQGRATTVAMFTNTLCIVAPPHVGLITANILNQLLAPGIKPIPRHPRLTPLATIPGRCSSWPTGSDRGASLSWTPRLSRLLVVLSPARRPVARLPWSRRYVMMWSMSPLVTAPAYSSACVSGPLSISSTFPTHCALAQNMAWPSSRMLNQRRLA